MASGSRKSTIFLGDSLTEQGQWSDWLSDYSAVNAGVAGNTTEDVLARLNEVIDQDPETVVLMIGTNDLAWRRSVEQIVRNVESILVALRKELPEVRLIAQSVLPRDADKADEIREINIHLWQFAPTVKAEWLDLWPTFADEQGELKAEYSEDLLHLTPAGYEAWVNAVRAVLANPPAPLTRSIPIIRQEQR
jgi:lysophospholipase L1-like esterase